MRKYINSMKRSSNNEKENHSVSSELCNDTVYVPHRHFFASAASETTLSELFTATTETEQSPSDFTLPAAPDGSHRISSADTEGFSFYSYTYRLKNGSWSKGTGTFNYPDRLYDGAAYPYSSWVLESPTSEAFYDGSAGLPLIDGSKMYQDLIYDLGGFL